jgi:hypothetical protein
MKSTSEYTQPAFYTVDEKEIPALKTLGKSIAEVDYRISVENQTAENALGTLIPCKNRIKELEAERADLIRSTDAVKKEFGPAIECDPF